MKGYSAAGGAVHSVWKQETPSPPSPYTAVCVHLYILMTSPPGAALHQQEGKQFTVYLTLNKFK